MTLFTELVKKISEEVATKLNLDFNTVSYGEICKVIEQKVLKNEQVKAITKEQQIMGGAPAK